MNYSDLLVVLAFVTGLYGLIVALTRQRNFLSRAVNPHRWSWMTAGLTCLWFGIGLMRLEARSWSPQDWVDTVSALWTDTPLSSRGKLASVSTLFGLLLMLLVFWCSINFPRDPATFRRPGQRGRALKYYVSRLRGGLDYAVLMRPGGERLEESVYEKHLRATLPHLPRVPGPNGVMVERTANEQVVYWRETADRLHRSMSQLDELIIPAHQGGNRRMVFDVEYGGIFFAYLRVPVPGRPEGEALFIFAATLNQEAMNNKQADSHFDLLLRALRQIDSNVRVA